MSDRRDDAIPYTKAWLEDQAKTMVGEWIREHPKRFAAPKHVWYIVVDHHHVTDVYLVVEIRHRERGTPSNLRYETAKVYISL